MQILHQLATAVPLSYADQDAVSPVVLWTLVIAGALVLLEWLFSRGR
jgi:hypothetical protein